MKSVRAVVGAVTIAVGIVVVVALVFNLCDQSRVPYCPGGVVVRMGRQHRDAKLDRVYFDPERVGSYGAVDALHRATGEVPKRTAKRWLSEQDAYTLHKPVRRRFKRRRVVVGGQN